jgi:Flp pilus assembly protein TadD
MSSSPSPDPKIKFSDGRPLTLAGRYLERALELYSQKRYNQALSDLDEALRAERRNPELYATRGYILMEIGYVEEAEADFKQALKIDPSQWIVHYARALHSFNAGDYAATLGHLNQARLFAPLRLEVLIYLAAAHYHLGDKALANQAIDDASQVLGPDDPRGKLLRKWKTAIKKMS